MIRARAETFFKKQWYQLTPWHVVLIPLSWLFAFVSWLRRQAYKCGILKTYKFPVPVIVVGNITVGGTGKTPLVIKLAKMLQESGYVPGIISRGYLGNSVAVAPVTKDSDPRLVGDEPVLIKRSGPWPVWVGNNRVLALQKLLEHHPECNLIISDDGLQHYRLQRDIEIAVIDGRGYGNERLLPAGPLREPKGRLDHIDAVVYNGRDNKHAAFKMHLEGEVFVNLSDRQRTAKPKDFAGMNICAIAGTGNPARFFEHLRSMGLEFKEQAFPDHHSFAPEDFQSIQADAILMTEKDAIKCAAFVQKYWWYLPVVAVIDETLISFVLKKLKG